MNENVIHYKDIIHYNIVTNTNLDHFTTALIRLHQSGSWRRQLTPSLQLMK